MPHLSNVVLDPIGGAPTNPANSVIKLTYTVTFDSLDVALSAPYQLRAHIIGDDTNVAGDAVGGVDDALWTSDLGVIYPKFGAQVKTAKFEVPDDFLNEDSVKDATTSNPDEIRVRIGMTPLKAYDVMSPESNLQTISLV